MNRVKSIPYLVSCLPLVRSLQREKGIARQVVVCKIWRDQLTVEDDVTVLD